jgi:hypothetical protein
MSTQQKVDTESGFFRFIIVGGMVLVVLVLFAICASVGYVVLRGFSSGSAGPAQEAAAEKDAQVVAQAFLADVRSGNAQAAYQKTSKRYRSMEPMGSFQGQVNQNNWLQSYKDKSQKMTTLAKDVHGRPITFAAVVNLSGEEGDVVGIHIDVVKEGDAWKVDNWHVNRD